MACGKCPQCGEQMQEESVYGAKTCRCPECGYKMKGTKEKPKQESPGMIYDKTPSMKKE